MTMYTMTNNTYDFSAAMKYPDDIELLNNLTNSLTTTLSLNIKSRITPEVLLDMNTLFVHESGKVNYEYLFNVSDMRTLNVEENDLLYSMRESTHRKVVFSKK
jgi:hypothetical protein